MSDLTDPSGHAHPENHADNEPHGSRRDYLIGFALAVVLTAIPFWLVIARPFASQPTALLIMAFAAVQMVVHMIYFLHMSWRSQGGWSIMALLFTVVLVLIALSGSLWVMYHMNSNMMPGMDMGGAG